MAKNEVSNNDNIVGFFEEINRFGDPGQTDKVSLHGLNWHSWINAVFELKQLSDTGQLSIRDLWNLGDTFDDPEKARSDAVRSIAERVREAFCNDVILRANVASSANKAPVLNLIDYFLDQKGGIEDEATYEFIKNLVGVYTRLLEGQFDDDVYSYSGWNLKKRAEVFAKNKAANAVHDFFKEKVAEVLPVLKGQLADYRREQLENNVEVMPVDVVSVESSVVTEPVMSSVEVSPSVTVAETRSSVPTEDRGLEVSQKRSDLQEALAVITPENAYQQFQELVDRGLLTLEQQDKWHKLVPSSPSWFSAEWFSELMPGNQPKKSLISPASLLKGFIYHNLSKLREADQEVSPEPEQSSEQQVLDAIATAEPVVPVSDLAADSLEPGTSDVVEIKIIINSDSDLSAQIGYLQSQLETMSPNMSAKELNAMFRSLNDRGFLTPEQTDAWPEAIGTSKNLEGDATALAAARQQLQRWLHGNLQVMEGKQTERDLYANAIDELIRDLQDAEAELLRAANITRRSSQDKERMAILEGFLGKQGYNMDGSKVVGQPATYDDALASLIQQGARLAVDCSHGKMPKCELGRKIDDFTNKLAHWKHACSQVKQEKPELEQPLSRFWNRVEMIGVKVVALWQKVQSATANFSGKLGALFQSGAVAVNSPKSGDDVTEEAVSSSTTIAPAA